MTEMLLGVLLGAMIVASLPTPLTTQADIQWAQEQCALNDGLAGLRPESAFSTRTALCRNGAQFRSNR